MFLIPNSRVFIKRKVVPTKPIVWNTSGRIIEGNHNGQVTQNFTFDKVANIRSDDSLANLLYVGQFPYHGLIRYIAVEVVAIHGKLGGTNTN